MRSKKAVFIPFVIGVLGLMPLLRNPRFEAYHTVDVVQLLASGMCFGVALTALMVMLRSRSTNNL
jgi:hypothetical protein